MARLALLALLTAFLVTACSAASPTPVTPSAGAPTAAQSPTTAPTAAPTVSPADAPTPAPTPSGTPGPSAAVVPAAPSTVKIAFKGSDPGGMGYDTDMTTTITWKEADPDGVTVRVFGVTACLPKAKVDHAPCLAKGTPLPANVRELITSAPASKGRVSWTWPNWEDAGGAVMAHGDAFYDSVVVAAYNKAGHSKFVIVRTGEYCPDCTY